VKDTGFVRKLDSVYRIVIPVELRRSMQIGLKEPAEIFVEEKDNIIVQKASEESAVVRKTDELGRISIPREIFRSHGIGPKAAVRFFADGQRLIIRKEAS
jgi:AbrB family transcriptional regulator, transcriptional pleiotropic regulator of transition state genes